MRYGSLFSGIGGFDLALERAGLRHGLRGGMVMGAVVLGTGRLSWARSERVSDRYGSVMLMHDGDSLTPTTGYESMADAPVGRVGWLVATVLETRDSTHIGDLFRGFYPGGAKVGMEYTLGKGTLFREDIASLGDPPLPVVGLRPDDGRDSDWLEPQVLYRCHEQTVRLVFVPEEAR